MLFNVGNLVTRKSYGNDIVFKIIGINKNVVYLKGVNVRLLADSDMMDLVKCQECEEKIHDDKDLLSRMEKDLDLNRDEYFYLPGKILHLDSDHDYLNRCRNFYDKLNIMNYGVTISENNMPYEIEGYLKKFNPDILVITGHDAFYKEKGTYKNSEKFIETVRQARKYEKSHEKLFIIAGACQSDYENLIKSGANFASSPKRINIHALDPAIIATSISLANKNDNIDLIKIINKTKYGKEGIGGIITKGSMYVGYPRQ